jgi:HK97 family phage prohead protease
MSTIERRASGPEVRFFDTGNLEVRGADKAGNHVEIIGTPVVYNRWYGVVDRKGEFQERMLPGVAKDVLNGDTRFLFNHDGLPLARTASGTLRLEDTPTALRCVPTVDIRQRAANDLVIAVERGDISQMSVGFMVGPGGDEWNRTRDERSVKRFKTMPDVSAVTYPASPSTSLELAQRMIGSYRNSDVSQFVSVGTYSASTDHLELTLRRAAARNNITGKQLQQISALADDGDDIARTALRYLQDGETLTYAWRTEVRRMLRTAA